MIKINNINKYFNKNKSNEIHVLNNISLNFEQTGLVCILGESGSGKTTLINTIGGIDNYQDGTITAYGKTFNSSNIKQYEKIRYKNYGYIFQNYYLLEGHSVYANIEFCLNTYNLSQEEKSRKINNVLKAVGMEKYANKDITRLSGGQQQRIAIARAIVKSPNVIFADEPTGNLDEENTLNVMKILKKISKKCLVIMVTHEKNIANFFADRIIEVSDGKIVSDNKILDTNREYTYIDNNNIFLKDYEKTNNSNDYLNSNYYSKNIKDNTSEKLELNIVHKNSKFYLAPTKNCEIIILDKNSDVKVLEKHKPILNLDNIEDNTEFKLEEINISKPPSLNFKQLFKLSINNIKRFGKNQKYFIATLFLVSILLTVTINNIISNYFIDYKNIAKHNSNYYTVEVSKKSNITTEKYNSLFDNIYNEFSNSSLKPFMYICNNPELKFTYYPYDQITTKSYIIKNFDIVPLKFLTKKDLLYGRMPTNPTEIVLDVQLIDKFKTDNTLLYSLIPSTDFFLDKNLSTVCKSNSFKIVGISNTHEPTIYIDKIGGLGLADMTKKLTYLSKFKHDFSDEFDNINLSYNEILLNKNCSNLGKNFKILGFKQNIKKIISKDFDSDIVINDEAYNIYLKKICNNNKKFNIYTNDTKIYDTFIKQLNNNEKYNKYISIVGKNALKEDIAKQVSRNLRNVNANKIIIFSIFIVSLVILYFTMKANSLRSIKDIMVYRLLGIEKLNIISLFVIETIIISTYTSFIGITITSLIYKFIASIPSLQLQDTISLVNVLYIIVGTYLLNIILRLLPINKLLKLMPAQITANYDI